MIIYTKSLAPKTLKYAFIFLAVGFTLISAYNGFSFYLIIFDFFTAILITVIFEIARLTSLFSLFHFKVKKNILSAIIYVIVASVCAFVSINSFTLKVIGQNLTEEREYQILVNEIKRVYSDRIEKKITNLERDINYLENMIARYPYSDYWKRRLSQIRMHRDNLIEERDKFLVQSPKNPEEWIQRNSAKLGLTLRLQKKSNKITFVNQALKELWGMDKVMAQKLMGVILALIIELSIILFAFLSSARIKSNELGYIGNEKDLVKTLISQFGKENVKKFISFSKDYFKRKGKLPPLRDLNPRLRPIRKAIESFDQKSIEKILGREKWI